MVNQKIALVIDDDPDIVQAIKDILREELRYLVMAARDPVTAVELARNYLFDLLVLDLHMPKLDGFQVLDLVRAKQPRVKVMVVTGLYEQYKDRFKDVRVDLIIEKPIDPVLFQSQVKTLAGSVGAVIEEEVKVIPKAKILLVDDEEDVCDTFKEFILEDKPNRYEVETARSAAEGMKLNHDLKPDMIFFDIKMPHFSGLEMMQKIRAEKAHEPLLCVAMTADPDQKAMKQIEALGYQVIMKPFRPEQVLSFIRQKCIELGKTEPA